MSKHSSYGRSRSDGAGPAADNNKKSAEEWAKIWFTKLARFHNVRNKAEWQIYV